MLEVTARRTVTRPQYQVFSNLVRINGYERLTPKAARAALTVAFGNDTYGEVVDENGNGYRITPKSCRKVNY